MFEIPPGNWPVALDASDPRDEFHRTALADARVTTELRPQLALLAQPGPSIIARLRLAFAGEQHGSTQPCSCPA
jgi:hypothetical protein